MTILREDHSPITFTSHLNHMASSMQSGAPAHSAAALAVAAIHPSPAGCVPVLASFLAQYASALSPVAPAPSALAPAAAFGIQGALAGVRPLAEAFAFHPVHGQTGCAALSPAVPAPCLTQMSGFYMHESIFIC